MQTRFPAISDDNVSPSYGFLPDHPPLKALPSYYSQWDNLATDLSSLIAGKCLRPAVSRLPALSTAHITTQEQLHRAFVVLGFLIHAYVWCDGSDRPEPNVPARLGEPYLEVCERLGMQPTLSYAGLCLWNWQIRDTAAGNAVNGEGNHQVNGVNEHITDGLSNLDNLDCLVSFTGTRDEAAFYLVPIMVEAEGGRLVSLLLEAMKEATQGDNHEKILNALEETQRTLPKMAALMKLLHEQCDPKVFYQLVRPFFPGAKGMEDKGMPDGVVFHRSDGSKLSAKCVGGSAAQSSYFQFVDSALGVKHRPVGTDKGETVFQVGSIRLCRNGC